MSAGDERRTRIVARLHALEHDDRLTPDDVIADAKDPESPLHNEFPWDVNEAALEHWRDIARRLIRSVVYSVEIDTRRIDVSRYVHDPDTKGQGYVTVPRVLSQRELAARCLAQEFERAEAACERSLSYAAIFKLSGEVTRLLARIHKLADKVKRAK